MGVRFLFEILGGCIEALAGVQIEAFTPNTVNRMASRFEVVDGRSHTDSSLLPRQIMQNSQALLIQSSKPSPGILFRLWQGFWLMTLVVSLGYAWYCFYVPKNDIAWAATYRSGKQLAANSGKPMVLFFTGKWCVPCRIMKRTVWADDEVESMVNEGFTPILIDMGSADDSSEVLDQYSVHATPTTIIADESGNVLEQVNGAMSKSELLSLLKMVRDKHHAKE